MAYLIHKANRFELDNNSISMGRGKDNDLVLSDNTVSRNHAIIKIIGKNYYLIDSGSSNGTYKDGKRVHSPVMLETKSLIQCGNAQIIFYDNTIEQFDEDMTTISFDSNIVVKSIILVADIKGYTTFSEITPIRKVSKFMSKWFTEVTNIIENGNGYLDSFIGDCVYARWDVEENNNKDIIKKILNISKKLNEITTKLTSEASENNFKLTLGIGIHIGDVIVGAVSNNTGLGDAVNTAFRLEGKTRILDTDILISKDIYDILEIDYDITEVQLKGKNFNNTVCSLKYDDIDDIK